MRKFSYIFAACYRGNHVQRYKKRPGNAIIYDHNKTVKGYEINHDALH